MKSDPQRPWVSLTFLLLVGRFGVNGVQWKARLPWDWEVSDSQCVHLLLSLAFGVTLEEPGKHWVSSYEQKLTEH